MSVKQAFQIAIYASCIDNVGSFDPFVKVVGARIVYNASQLMSVRKMILAIRRPVVWILNLH